MTKIIRAINVKTVCNIETKPWSQMSSFGSVFLVLGLKSWVPDTGALVWILSPKSFSGKLSQRMCDR